MTEQIFKQDAKQMVDVMFDSKIFIDTVTRDDMNGFQDLIQYLLQSKFESYKRINELTERINKINI